MANETPISANPKRNLEPFFQGRLTKKALMSLPEGILLQSNVGDNPLTPTFEGVLGPLETREALWRKLIELRVDGRTFRGFTTEESYDQDFAQRINALKLSDVVEH